MPVDDGLGLTMINKALGPMGPATAESNPEDPIQPFQFGPWMLAFEHGELLP